MSLDKVLDDGHPHVWVVELKGRQGVKGYHHSARYEFKSCSNDVLVSERLQGSSGSHTVSLQ